MRTHVNGTLRMAGLTAAFVVILFGLASFAFAQNPPPPRPYVPLVVLPGLQSTGQGGLAAYFNQLYMFTVAVGAILAFLKIAFAGAKYSMSEVVTSKEDAKNDIKGALLGLAILLIPFIVLNTIYPGLTNLNILEDAGNVRVTPSPGGASGAGGGGASGAGGGGTSNTSNSGNLGYTSQQVVKNYTPAELNCAPVLPSASGGEFGYASLYNCDLSSAQASCAGLNGTFSITSYDLTSGIQTASCTYYQAIPPSTAACALGVC